MAITTVDPRRIHPLNQVPPAAGPVIYWMSRDQRAADNWALIHAQQEALSRKAPLAVVFTLAGSFLGATLRQYGFMLRGLAQTGSRLRELGIPLILLRGDPPEEICRFASQVKPGLLITDFDPLRIKRRWHERVAGSVRVSFCEVDSHNIVPCRVASHKQEFAAYTIRPKIRRLLREFLTGFPEMVPHPYPWPAAVSPFDPGEELGRLLIDRSVGEVTRIVPGEAAGMERLRSFIDEGLPLYGERRNDPCADGQSGLSPWLHFGQLSPQRVALEVSRSQGCESSQEAFLEELIVRRELADNFCLYNENYDSATGFADWAKGSLAAHAGDPRQYLYSPEEWESARTHDPLWNAAQRSMVTCGTMHGYMRMYWAKKILEWSASVEEAMETAIRLNDRYQLDGRDPNGYAGIAWSIGGVHDRAWGDRPVFGKVRYMNDKGCRRKFDLAAYLRMFGGG